jgi:hypothetical protein
MAPGRRLSAVLLPAVLAQAAWGDPFDALARGLTRDLGPHAGETAAVVPFTRADGRFSGGGAAVAEALSTALVGKGLVLIERSRLDSLLKEIEIQRSGITKPGSELSLGKMAGASLLVTGTLSDAGSGRVEANARLVRVETGEVLAAAKAGLDKVWTDLPPPEPQAASAPPRGDSLRFEIRVSSARGPARSVEGRRLYFQYVNLPESAGLRVTDFTDDARPVFVEFPFPFDRQTRWDDVLVSWSKAFSLAGRSYRMSADESLEVHVAPVRGFWRRRVEEAEVVVPFSEMFKAWSDDAASRAVALEVHPEHLEGGVESPLAYFEPLGGGRLRISILKWSFDPMESRRGLDPCPLDILELGGRPGEVAVSRLMRAGAASYRFRFAADALEISAEEVR